MERAVIAERTIRVISQNSRYTVHEIKETDPLDKFVTSFMKDKLAREFAREFDQVDSEHLTNQLYDVLKKVSQLIDYIHVQYD